VQADCERVEKVYSKATDEQQALREVEQALRQEVVALHADVDQLKCELQAKEVCKGWLRCFVR
jgi:hypothetical protein